MNPLIFTVGIGEWHRWAASALVRSLHDAHLDCDIVAVTDGDIPGARIVTPVPCPERADFLPAHEAQMQRYHLADTVDLSGYSTVTYLDADCLVRQDVNTDDFAKEFFQTKPAFALELADFGIIEIGHPGQKSWSGEAMEDSFYDYVSDRPAVNSGAFSMDPESYSEMCTGVKEIASRKLCGSDQPYLTLFLYAHEARFPWGWLSSDAIASAAYGGTPMVRHYCGRSVELTTTIEARYPELKRA
jgi:hypothetical protein